ncbi:MAG: class I SAM-dependent methyltransferase [bacterium]
MVATMEDQEYEIMYQVEDTHFWFRGMRSVIHTLLAQLTFPPKAKILDAGCGTGAYMLFLKRFGQVMGIDYSPRAVRFSSRRGLKVRKGSINKLPYRDSTFDLVTCLDVFDAETVKEKTAISEFYRVLKPGGYLIIHVPAYQWLHCSHDQIFHTARRYTIRSLASVVTRVKLKIIRITYANTILFPLEALKRLSRKYFPSLYRELKSDVTSVPILLNFLLYLPLFLEAQLLRFFNLPFGLSVIVVAQKKK